MSQVIREVATEHKKTNNYVSLVEETVKVNLPSLMQAS